MKKKICICILSLITAACGQHQEVNTSRAEDDAAVAAKMFNAPECAQFNKDGTRKIAGGCTREQWAEWHKTH